MRNVSICPAWGRQGGMRPWTARVCLALCGAAALLSGCGSAKSGAPTARLEGSVTLDGVAVEAGTLNFLPQGSGQAQPASARITAGKYVATEVPHGKVLVRISAQKATGKMIEIPGSESFAEMIDIVPAKYAAGIPLEIAGDNPNQNFELTSM